MTKTAVISINTSWNIVNFRSGLIGALQDAGYRVVAIAPADAHSARLAALGVEFHPIAIDSKGLSVRRDLRLIGRYWRLLRSVRPDVFLGYTAKPNIYGSIAARLLGVAVINNVSGLGTAFIRASWLTRLVSGLYRFALAGSKTVFFQNAEDRDLFVANRLVSAGQAQVLPGSGIDTGRFAPSEPRADGGGPTFLLVARLLWDKGVGEFVAAARHLRGELPGARFQLLGFLDVDNSTAVSRADVDGWVAEGLVEYLGVTDDVRPFVAAADCVVLPSYREGLPRSLIEAGALGRPAITTDVPGCRAIVRDGVNGLLCAVRDPIALAGAMRAFAALGPGERLAMGRRARAIVEAEYDERIVIERYLAAIRAATG